MCNGCHGDSCLCRYPRDAAVSRTGRLEKIDRECISRVFVALQACTGRVEPSYSCIHVSRATLISFEGQARRNTPVQWQMEDGCKNANRSKTEVHLNSRWTGVWPYLVLFYNLGQSN